MDNTHKVRQALTNLGSGERVRLLRELSIQEHFSHNPPPHILLREVPAYVVEHQLVEKFFTSYRKIRGIEDTFTVKERDKAMRAQRRFLKEHLAEEQDRLQNMINDLGDMISGHLDADNFYLERRNGDLYMQNPLNTGWLMKVTDV